MNVNAQLELKLTQIHYIINKQNKQMSFNKSLSIRRKEKDIFKLRNANYKIIDTQSQSTYQVEFKGPKETAYQKGKWTINLFLPNQYPYKSPSVGFLNKIFHPNIDFCSGSVCLDVINQTWTPMYELVNIFQIFLPQLLTYPNPASPLNHEAATLFQKNTQQFNKKVIQCIQKHALNEEYIVKKQEKKQPQMQEQNLQKIKLNEQKLQEQEQQIENQQQHQIDSVSNGSCSLSQRDSINDNEDLKMY